ncbi:multiple sugar transport system permease protein [Paenibacillus algorifonticola]|uniref:Multiple sugar transport system permease protein n=1 Tax=Paenibacillus algorifonticola TaxID=684063 RepID=A0A1I2FW47_9BACL|nr:carbohydrate ABC transporter permease [Paenibacillus algorifonticola]SFF08900.1 multiple sugar transport system permease protein [Paenibacillus algorifonticola]
MIKESAGDRLLLSLMYVGITVFALVCLIPFMTVISGSLSTEGSIIRNGFTLLPKEFSLEAYKLLLKDSTIYKSYGVTIFVTVVGTVLAMIVTCALAYPLSVKSLKYRNSINFYVFFTMLFHGGLVATYLLISKYLGLKDTIWVLIIPALINPWNMFLMRNFFNSIDESIGESAKIDGANDVYIMFRIMIPISLPAIATISLFYALAFWNKWFEAMLYISNEDLFPLQYLIKRILDNAAFANNLASGVTAPGYIVPTLTSRLATTVVTIGPIIFLYPFLQKYFVKGLLVGSVKG